MKKFEVSKQTLEMSFLGLYEIAKESNIKVGELSKTKKKILSKLSDKSKTVKTEIVKEQIAESLYELKQVLQVNHSKAFKVIHNALRFHIVNHMETSDGSSIILELKDVNANVKGRTWETFVREQLFDIDYIVEIEYGNGDIVTLFPCHEDDL